MEQDMDEKWKRLKYLQDSQTVPMGGDVKQIEFSNPYFSLNLFLFSTYSGSLKNQPADR